MWKILAVLASGTLLWQLTSPSVPQPRALLPELILPEAAHVAFTSWIRTAFSQNQILQVSLSTENFDSDLVLMRIICTETGALELLSASSLCSAHSKLKTKGKWQQVVLHCTPGRCCLQDSQCSSGLASAEPYRVELGSSQGGVEFLNAKWVVGSAEDLALFLLLEDHQGEIQDFAQVLPATEPIPLHSIRWHYLAESVTSTIGVSGWFRLEGSSFKRLLTAVSSGCEPCGLNAFCGAECEQVELHETEGMVQVCAQRRLHVYCLDPLAVAKLDWTYISLAVTAESLHLCTAQLWQSATCLHSQVAGLPSSQKSFTSLWLDGVCLYAFDIRVYFSPFEPFEDTYTALETQESACIYTCPLTALRPSCLVSRKLATTHYSGITWQSYMANPNDNYFFTFVNTHVSTDYIFMIGDSFGCDNCDPDIFIYKPWNNNLAAFDWKMDNWLTSAFTLYPTDPLLPSKGGIMGLYTFRVKGWNAGWPFEARVRIACSSPSLVPCSCAVGTYYDAVASSCTACPSGDLICPFASNTGCLPYLGYNAGNKQLQLQRLLRSSDVFGLGHWNLSRL